MTQQDDITQRLRDNANLDEAEHGNARVVRLERDAADEIERLRAELSKLRAPVADERDRNATISQIVGLCNRIPGATTWNAAQFMYDEMHRRAALASAPVAEPRLEWSAKALYDAIKDVLLNHRLSNLVDEDGEFFPLVDHLRSQDDKTTESGEFEIALICDAIYNDVLTKSAPVAGEAQAPWGEIREDANGDLAIFTPNHNAKLATFSPGAAGEFVAGDVLYAAPQASECECSRKSKAVSDSEAQL